MLVLSRHKNERVIMPGLGVVVTVVDIRGDKVRLGFSLPDDEPCHRSEVWDRIQQQQREGDHGA